MCFFSFNISYYLSSFFSFIFAGQRKILYFSLFYYFKNLIAEELDGRADEVAGMSNWANLYVSNTVLKAIADMGYFPITYELYGL